MSELKLRRDSGQQLVYGHSPAGGAVALVAAAGIAVLLRGVTGTVATAALAFADLIAVAGLYALLWRDDFRLDLARRKYRRRRGFWPAPSVRSGNLEQIAGLELRSKGSWSRGRPRTEWEIWLRFTNDEPAVRLFETNYETPARREITKLSGRLGVPML
jgi:hypothetical protein